MLYFSIFNFCEDHCIDNYFPLIEGIKNNESPFDDVEIEGCNIRLLLDKKNLYEEIVKEINGGVMPDQTDADSNVFDATFGNAGPTVLEEYQLKVEEQTRELGDI